MSRKRWLDFLGCQCKVSFPVNSGITRFGNGIESTKDLDDLGLNKYILLRIFDCFFNGLHDYTNDAKGDSGSM